MKALLAVFTLSVLAACSGDKVQASTGDSKAPAADCCEGGGCCADKAPAKEATAKQGDACCAEGAAKEGACCADGAAKEGAAKEGAAKQGACECCAEKAPDWKPGASTKPKQ